MSSLPRMEKRVPIYPSSRGRYKSVDTEQPLEDKLLPNWQVTATTIICNKVGQETTIMVYKDWHTACVYHTRWGPMRRQKKEGIMGLMARIGIVVPEEYIPSECSGPLKCASICEYRDELVRQEKSTQAQQ